MKLRLVLLLALLCLAIAAWVYVDRNVAPDVRVRAERAAETLKSVAPVDQARLKVLQTQFVEARDKYFELRKAGAAKAEVEAQYRRVLSATKAVQAVGGIDAVRALPRSKYEPTSRP